MKTPAGKEVAVLLMDTQGAFDSNRLVLAEYVNFVSLPILRNWKEHICKTVFS